MQATSRQLQFHLCQFQTPAKINFLGLVQTIGRLSEIWSCPTYTRLYCFLQYYKNSAPLLVRGAVNGIDFCSTNWPNVLGWYTFYPAFVKCTPSARSKFCWQNFSKSRGNTAQLTTNRLLALMSLRSRSRSIGSKPCKRSTAHFFAYADTGKIG